jgi:hypothetical protein
MRPRASAMIKVTKRFGILLLTICSMQLSLPASPKRARAATYEPTKSSTANSLEQLSSSLQDIAKQVEPAVVRILNSAYAIENEDDHSGGTVVSQQRSSGSGILISSDGYIVTNAHVVQGARRLRVRLNNRVSKAGSHLVDAKLIGMDRQTDLAVTGTIVDATNGKRSDGMRKEADGDTHGWLKVDSQFKNLLNAGNMSNEGGNLVFEIVCKFNVSQADAKASCPASYHTPVTLPAVGSHVRIVGSYIQETNHAKWMEIHPVSTITVVP